MKENRNHGSNFEERLLDELKTVVARRGAEQAAATETAAHSPAWRRVPRLALGATAVLAAGAALLVFNSGSDNTSKAFAVEPQDGGGVTIKIYSAEDAAGLEGALGEAGIRSQVTWLPAGMTCREPRFSPSTVNTSAGGTIGGIVMAGPGEAMTIGVMSAQQWRESVQQWRESREERGPSEISREEISEGKYLDPIPNINLEPESFRPDQTVVISGSRGPYDGDPEGGYEAQLAIAAGPVEPCEPVRVPDGASLAEINRVLESESAPARLARLHAHLLRPRSSTPRTEKGPR